MTRVIPAAEEPCAMRAAIGNDDSIARIDAACRATAAGKLAARAIVDWVRGFQISEAEFRLLWMVNQQGSRVAAEFGLDQAQLAEGLVVSPAQVSGAVERLRQLEFLERVSDPADRRRQLWRIAPAGVELLALIAAASNGKSMLPGSTLSCTEPLSAARLPREEAA